VLHGSRGQTLGGWINVMMGKMRGEGWRGDGVV
jgi:hypothetical protein